MPATISEITSNSIAEELFFEKGDKIVYKGELVTKVKRDALQKAGYNVLELNLKGIIGIFCLVAFGIIALMYYLQYFEKKFLNKNYLSITGLLALVMAGCATLLPDGASFYYLPFPAFAILLSIFTNPRVSFLSSAILIIIISMTVIRESPLGDIPR